MDGTLLVTGQVFDPSDLSTSTRSVRTCWSTAGGAEPPHPGEPPILARTLQSTDDGTLLPKQFGDRPGDEDAAGTQADL
jgi:hypothetical protein